MLTLKQILRVSRFLAQTDPRYATSKIPNESKSAKISLVYKEDPKTGDVNIIHKPDLS